MAFEASFECEEGFEHDLDDAMCEGAMIRNKHDRGELESERRHRKEGSALVLLQ